MPTSHLRALHIFFRPGYFMFSIAALFSLLLIFYRPLGLPSNVEAISWFKELFSNHGLIIVLFGALIESFFMLSMYLPGSAVILIAVVVFGRDIESLVYISALTVLGYLISNIINYSLGRFGYYKLLLILGGKLELERMRERFTRSAHRTIAISAFHPNFLAIAIVAAGIVRYGWIRTFRIAIPASALWTVFWTILVSRFTNMINLEDSGNEPAYFFLGIIVIWGLGICFVEYYKRKRNFSKTN